MQEIIQLITQAEMQATQIKSNAQEKAEKIVADAEERAAGIARLTEAECKALRENRVKAATESAQKNYDEQITVSRAKSSKYCADRLKTADQSVNDIVRRIVRGSR